MKVWLDDIHEGPQDYIWVQSCPECIDILRRGKVTEISLDRDLGDNDENGTGEDVLRFIELKLKLKQIPKLKIEIHTSNAVARQRMELAVKRMRSRGDID